MIGVVAGSHPCRRNRRSIRESETALESDEAWQGTLRIVAFRRRRIRGGSILMTMGAWITVG